MMLSVEIYLMATKQIGLHMSVVNNYIHIYALS